MSYKVVYTNNLTLLEPFEEKEVKTSIDYAGQVLNLVAPVVKCKHLSKNFHIREGRKERDFRNDTRIKVHNEIDEPTVLGEVFLIAYAAEADEAINTKIKRKVEGNNTIKQKVILQRNYSNRTRDLSIT